MNTTPKTTQPTLGFVNGHPSRFDLEAVSAESLSEAGRPALRAHLETCNACNTFVAELHNEQLALMARLPPAAFMHQVTSRAEARLPRRWLRAMRNHRLAFAGGFASAMVAVALLFVVMPSTRDEASFANRGNDNMRSMGQQPSTLVVKLRRADTTMVEVTHNEAVKVHGGEALRLQITVAQPSILAVVELTANGTLTRLIDPTAISAGTWVQPDSFVFDDAREDERVIVVLSPNATDAEATLASLRQLARQGRTGFYDPKAFSHNAIIWTGVFLKQ